MDEITQAERDDDTPELFQKAMAMHFGAVLGTTECDGCAEIMAEICNSVLDKFKSPWRLVASGSGQPRHHLH